MLYTKPMEFWFITGSQHLYGHEILEQVEIHSQTIAEGLNRNFIERERIVFKSVLTTSDAIRRVCLEANSDDNCAGVIAWMHTFSPAKMWISGLNELSKPLLHFHTQFNRDIPWNSIDMDYMNLNQAAHGDREFGFIGSRMRIARKVVVGYWEDTEVLRRVKNWMDTAVAFVEGRRLKIVRFGDNMRDVAVTEGDKVEAQIKFGWSVNTYPVSELVKYIDGIEDTQVNRLFEEYCEIYDVSQDAYTEEVTRNSILEQARIELGMRAFLQEGKFEAFTTTFEDLHYMKQLPGLAVQRLMAEGYGFGGEGDWKTAALVRIMKVIAGGKGTSFMEDYTYHLEPGNDMVLGAHMLEVCPTIAAQRPKLEVHPLSIGNKAYTARLVFSGNAGYAVCASLVDMGSRFRLVVNKVEAVKSSESMPKLPVASILWKPKPSLQDSAQAWILAGGAHHTAFSFATTVEHLSDWAEMTGIECVVIDENTKLQTFKNELRLSDVAWRLML